MHHIQSIILSAFFLLLVGSAKAQQTSLNGWFLFLGTYKINKSFTFYVDGQLRSNNQLKNVQTTILRPGINFKLRNNVIATLGYAFVENRRTIGNVSGYAPEHRIWEQLQVMHPLAFTTLNHRFRLEQRFISRSIISGNSLRTNGNHYANRFRYFFRDIVPFNGKKNFSQGAFAALQNEIFINIGDKSSLNKKYFDQNRVYFAMGYRFSQAMDAEAGYLNQYIAGLNSSFTNNHNIQIALYVRL